MATTKFSFLEIEKELNKFTGKVLDNREDALDETADYMMNQLKNATPVNSGKTKDSWNRTTKYKGVRYINNSAVTGERPNSSSNGIPIVNLLEYSSRGHPFARKTFKKNLSKIESLFTKKIIEGV